MKYDKSPHTVREYEHTFMLGQCEGLSVTYYHRPRLLFCLISISLGFVKIGLTSLDFSSFLALFLTMELLLCLAEAARPCLLRLLRGILIKLLVIFHMWHGKPISTV